MAKILVFTSHGGGGHISASQALKEYLSDQHDVTVIPFFIEVLDRMDPVKRMTFKKYHVEDIYNFFLRRKWSKMLNAMYSMSQYCMPLLGPVIRQLTLNFINAHGKPDLIISVIPLVNHAILSVAEQFDIPFLLIPTDLDSSTFLFGIDKPSYKKFKLSLPFSDTAIAQKISKSVIDGKQIVVSGFPIRSSFLQYKDKSRLKSEFNIDLRKPVILLMMGAEGSSATLLYIKELIKLDHNLHIVVILGRNTALTKEVEKLEWPKHISHSLIGFTDRIADLMAIADLCITKSGSVSVSECIYMQVPTILDGMGNALLWEQFNLNFIKERKLGDVIYYRDDVSTLINFYLSNVQARERISNNLRAFKPPEFQMNIQHIVSQMIS